MESLRELIMVENSRRNTDLVADLILKKPDLFEDLFTIYLLNEEPISRRAAWIVDTISEKRPELVIPYVDIMVENLPGFSHDGMKRSTLRMLTQLPLPLKEPGVLLDVCFDWLTSRDESVAVKVYAMDILYLFTTVEPDLKKELADSIEWRMQEESAGFNAHGKKILKKLYAEMR